MTMINTNYTQRAKDSYIVQSNDTKHSADTKDSSKTSSEVIQTLGKDTFVKSDETDYIETYKPVQKKKLTSKEIDALKEEQKNNELELVRQFINDTVNKQNNIYSKLTTRSSNLLTSIFGSIDAAYPPVGTTPEEAKKAISEGGAYSVEAVSDRIMKMAKAIAGDDEEKIQQMRDAVEKGFKAAGVDFKKNTNSKLPQICDDTYDEVMKRFDKLQNKDSSSSADKTENK